MDDLLEARDSFVAMIKEENITLDRSLRRSLKRNWAGPQHGFADPLLQRRWQDFYRGWRHARDFMKRAQK